MDWNAVKLLRKHKKRLSKTLQSYVSKNYPKRTTETKKCARDISFIVQALSTCIQSNNTLAIDHIVKIFYLGDKLQLQSIDVELAVYDKLEEDILEIFNNNDISEESKNIVSSCIEILKLGLENGPNVVNSQWANRRNYKVYDTSEVIPVYMQEHIETILQDAPMQTSGKSRFSICKLLPSDLKIKEFLATNYFFNRDLNRHEMAIITAPIIYLAMAHTEDNSSHFEGEFDEGSWPTKHFHIGMHGGAALDYVLSQGYDFSFIGCTDDPSDEITQQWSKIILERFNYKTNAFAPWPLVAFCIGKGIEKFDHELKYYKTLDGKMLPYHYTGEKSIQKKSNILYY